MEGRWLHSWTMEWMRDLSVRWRYHPTFRDTVTQWAVMSIPLFGILVFMAFVAVLMLTPEACRVDLYNAIAGLPVAEGTPASCTGG